MSPRRHRRSESGDQDRELRGGNRTVEDHPDGTWVVQQITGSSSTKAYRCPGCDQEIRTATPHTVAWPEEDVENRRHWHNACWQRRDRRTPKVQRTRNAPRY
jgi:hypothetical protein